MTNQLILPTHEFISWNVNSLSAHPNKPAGIARRNNITRNLRALMQKTKIFCLQETHLNYKDTIALATTFGKWLRIYNNGDGRKGTMMLIAPSILKHYHVRDITPSSIVRGRVQVVNFIPKNDSTGASPFKVINCYFPTGGKALNSRRIKIFDEIRKLTEEMHTFLMGDLNFIDHDDDTTNPDPKSNFGLSIAAKDAWESLLESYDLREVHQPVHTFVRTNEDKSKPHHSSRLDRAYISHSEADQTLFTPTTYLPAITHNAISASKNSEDGKKNIYAAASDHFPLALRFVSTAPSKKRDFNIPAWVGKTPTFKSHFEANWPAKADRLPNCPFVVELAFKKQIIRSAKHILKTPTNKAMTDSISMLTRAISVFRMAMSNSDYGDKMQEMAEVDSHLADCLHEDAEGRVTVCYKSISTYISSMLADSRPREWEENQKQPRTSRMTNIIQNVKTELPSTRKRLLYLKEEGKEPNDDPQAMARDIKAYWQQLWTARENMPTLEELEHYLDKYDKRIPPELLPQLPALYHFVAAIEDTNDSAAGKDGIPFSCYRALTTTAAPILMQVFLGLAAGHPPLIGFNHGRLYMAPKDDSMRVDHLRPITINNSDNRIMTTVQVVLITPAMQELIEDSQKGFILGRKGTDHVTDLNKSFYDDVRHKKSGYVLFLDTKKAFDSVDHQFVAAMLRKVGMPNWCIAFVMALFDNVLVTPVLSEKTNVTIAIGRGVKQGCPLSPLLFALTYDVLLVYLAATGVLYLFAFADDLAGKGSREALAAAMIIIDRFAVISGLGINRDKTVIIKSKPFTASDAEFFKNSTWPDVVLAEMHIYLGVLFGRRVNTAMVFQDAMVKFTKRAALYRRVIKSKSIDQRIIICNVFLTTIFSYLMQFFIMPRDEVIAKVRNVLRKLIIPFNGGAFAYIHLVIPTKDMGFKQPLRDLWAAGITALTAGIDFEAFNGMNHPPLLASKPYLDKNDWQSMHIDDHRDAAALDLLTFEGARHFTGVVKVNYVGSSKNRLIYNDAILLEYDDEVMNIDNTTSLPSKLCRTWGLVGRYAQSLRTNAGDIAAWVPAHYRSNHIKLVFNALATDIKRDSHGGEGEETRRALGFPCYMCGKSNDSTHHMYARCEVVRHARHVFLQRLGCLPSMLLHLPEEVLATGAFPEEVFPKKLISAVVIFNHAVWDHSRTFFKAMGEPLPFHVASERIATYATTLWNIAAPKKLRSEVKNTSFFMPRLPTTAAYVQGCRPP